MIDAVDASQRGSSPHTRGAPIDGVQRVAGDGDHPRIRGEHPAKRRAHVDGLGIIPAYAGSTRDGPEEIVRQVDHPRIRGEHVHRRDGRAQVHGIIPAYAGSTFATLMSPVAAVGSSPHTRGAPRRDEPAPGIRGIIPAYAGSTAVEPAPPCGVLGSSPHTRGAPGIRGSRVPRPVDHPRIRGEHRVRHGERRGNGGIIPAYAGSTIVLDNTNPLYKGSSPHTRGARRGSALVRDARGDHPRIRGEHVTLTTRRAGFDGIIPAYAGSTIAGTDATITKKGSSPHTRGARCVCGSHRLFARDHPRIRGEHTRPALSLRHVGGIIPAYAGSTASTNGCGRPISGSSPHTRGARGRLSRILPTPWDHPRIRGEHEQAPELLLVVEGIIPAYAGSTSPVAWFVIANPGSSPHTRGAPRSASASLSACVGSSPHTRGAPVLSPRGRRHQRIIPAYAGSTCRWSASGWSTLGSSPHTRGALCHCLHFMPSFRDHPRIRGEHVVGGVFVLRRAGIIPAYAGSTLVHHLVLPFGWGSSPHARGALACPASRLLVPGDHPRIRGEHLASPPAHHVMLGIIPAYAGSTRSRTSWGSG